MKRVIILDFKNLDKNPDYQYLESSITEAVKTDLKAKFVFREMPTEEWQKLATENLFAWPEENYTKGFGVNLGKAGRQDVVIGGYFQATKSRKKGNTATVIRTNVFIVDVRKKSLASEFEIELPTDAKLFESISQLTGKVVEESKSVLPNEEEIKQIGGVVEPRSVNEIRIAGGVNLLSLPKPFDENFAAGKVLHAKDISHAIQIDAAYVRHDLFWPQVQLALGAGMQTGTGELSVATESKKIRASLLGFSASALAGYRFEWRSLNVTPSAGIGFYLGRMKLDYTTLTLLPVDSTGAERSGAALNTSAPFAEAGVQVGYQLNTYLLFYISTHYRQYINLGAGTGQGYAGGGIGFRL